MLRRLLAAASLQLAHHGRAPTAAAAVAPAFARRHSSDSAGRRPSHDEAAAPAAVLAAAPDADAAALIDAVAPPTAAPALPSAAADLQLLVHHLRALEARDARAKRGDASPSAAHAQLAAKRLANPLTPQHHPLLTDDFSVQPPFVRPGAPDARKVFGPFEALDVFGIGKAPCEGANGVGTRARQALEDAAHERAAVALVGHANFPYLLAPTLPLLPIKPTAVSAPLPPGAAAAAVEAGEQVENEDEGHLTMQLLSPAGATELPPGILAMQQQAQHQDGEMLMTSVLRKRRKRMNKHKLRKLRKRTRAQRK